MKSHGAAHPLAHRPHPPPPVILNLPPLKHPSAGRPLNDLHSFDPATMTWTLLSPANDAGRPSARANHGFTSAGGRLYVHGGYGDAGEADLTAGSWVGMGGA